MTGRLCQLFNAANLGILNPYPTHDPIRTPYESTKYRRRSYSKIPDNQPKEQTLQTSPADASDAQPMDSFKPPPTAECILNDDCLSFGKKTPTPGQICAECLRFYEIPQLQKWAAADNGALALIDAELSRRQQAKANIETSGKFLCAFEDPDFRNSPWRADEFNLRILRGRKADCGRVSRKGKACDPCWKQYLQKVAVVKYFDPTGMCHEQVDKMAAESSKSKAVENQSADADDDDDWGDVEGYDTI